MTVATGNAVRSHAESHMLNLDYATRYETVKNDSQLAIRRHKENMVNLYDLKGMLG